MTRVLALLLLAAPASAVTFDWVRTVPNPAPAASDFFGGAVALGTDALLVGARFDDPSSTTNAGAAYVFDLATGALRLTFTAPTPAAGDLLGFAVAADGGILVVAASEAAARAGVVYRVGTTRAYATGTTGGKLGYAVAVAGNDLLAGAPYESAAGAAHLFDVASGVQLRDLPDPTPDADDLFGRAVAIAAPDILAVGAPLDDAPAANAGVVHLFARGSGGLLRTLTAPQPEAGDNFGAALAADGHYLAVGAPYADAAGAVYVFDAGTGDLVVALASPEPDARFGAAVALSAGRVLVGAPFADGDVNDAGAAYVFGLDGTLLATLASPAPHAGDQFGAAVALAGPLAAVGAWLDDTTVDNAGAVFLFVDDTVPTTTSTSTSSTTLTSVTVTTTTSLEPTTTDTTSTVTTTVTETTDLPTTSTATTTTAVTSGGSQRTTTTVVTCATGCDDGDACTVDTCAHDACTNDLLPGFDGIVCRLDLVDAALHGEPVTGRRLTTRLQRKLARARHLVETAREQPAKRAVRRADRALAAFIGTIKRAQRTGRIAYAVADRLLTLSTDAATQLKPLR